MAVLGSPIAHSLSPVLHAAAYGALGLDWTYGAVDLTGENLARFLDDCGPEWRGLSLTMPLKRDVIPLLDHIDRIADLTGAVNTVLFRDGRRLGFNTDVGGITRAFIQAGITELRDVAILGGGATAASALVATAELGAQSVQFWVRSPERASVLRELAVRLEIEARVHAFTDMHTSVGNPDAVMSTLPSGSVVDLVLPERVRQHSVLFDVAYDPWPTALATAWTDASGQVISGLEMLINQAVMQVRIFLSGDPEQHLPDEDRVLEAMRESVRRP